MECICVHTPLPTHPTNFICWSFSLPVWLCLKMELWKVVSFNAPSSHLLLYKKRKSTEMTLSAMWENSWKAANCKPENGIFPDARSSGPLGLNFPASVTVRKRACSLRHPVSDIFVMATHTKSQFLFTSKVRSFPIFLLCWQMYLIDLVTLSNSQSVS